MSYFVRSLHTKWLWKADEAFLTPALALERAKELSNELPDLAVVSCDARNWVTYNKGEVSDLTPWGHFYPDEPSELYVKLMEELQKMSAKELRAFSRG